jgi:hypothetical protein
VAGGGNDNVLSSINSTSNTATNTTAEDYDYILFVILNRFIFLIYYNTTPAYHFFKIKFIQGKYCTEPTCRRVLGSSQSAFYHLSSHRTYPLRNRFPIRVLQSLFPHTRKKLWFRPFRSYSNAVSIFYFY